jgi:pectin methylesterase-like acyl-CoA thioesterase
MKKIITMIIFMSLTSIGYSQTLTVSPTSLAYNGNNIINTNSPVMLMTLAGATLIGPFPTNVTVTAPAGFLISKSNYTGFTSTLTFQVDSATLSSKNIYVAFSPNLAVSYNDTIRLAGAGAAQAKVAVSGTGVKVGGTWLRSKGNGTWSTLAWEASSDSGLTWSAAMAPTGSEKIIIPGTCVDTVDIPLNWTGYIKNYGSFVVGTVGSVTFSTGSIYEHAQNAGAIPLSTWGTGSTCLITGTTSSQPTTNMIQNFYNFTWNCPYQNTNLNMAWDNITIGGDLICSASGTGPAQIRLTSAATVRNITIMGNVIVSGGYLTASGSSGAAQYNIKVYKDINILGGSFNLCGGSGGWGTWYLRGSLSIAAAGKFVSSSNTTKNTRLVFDSTVVVPHTFSNLGSLGTVNFGVEKGATVQLNSPLSVADTLVLNNGTFITTTTNPITVTTAGVIVGASSSSYINGPLVITNGSTSSKVINFPIGKGTAYRPVTLTLTQDASTATTYTAEIFNSAPTTRKLPFVLDRVSSVRYCNLTKGAGANVSTASIQLSYGLDDGMLRKDSIRIAKSDTLGNWISLGGSGTADTTGTIISNTFGSTTGFGSLQNNDFVLGHVNPLAIPVIATVLTAPVSFISTTTATCGGNVTNDGNAAVSARGTCWDTLPNPTIAKSKTSDGAGAGTFVSFLTGLTAGKKYYVRAYATNSSGTGYGNQDSLLTLLTLVAPTVTTDSVKNLVNTTATGYGTVKDWGGTSVTASGICWGPAHNPTTINNYNIGGTGIGSFNAPIGGLLLGTTYYVRAFATNSVGTSYGAELSITTAAAQPDVRKVVDKNGTVGVNCDYTTVQAAFNAVPSNYTGHWFIYVKKGTYYEKDLLAADRINVVLAGQSRDSTILTYDDYSGKNTISNGTNTSYSVAIDASDFQAQNITFQNTANAYAPGSSATQAVALRANGDRQSYYNCRMLGYQDTYYTQGGLTGPDRLYHKNCYIEGSVDFIFGRDVALFDSCTIFCNRNGGVLTAAATEVGFQFGYVFLNCTISSTPAGQNGADGNPMVSFYLGRPWQTAPKTVYLYCNEPATVNAAGWTLMGPSPALYSEYNCTGPGAVASRPVITSWTTNQPSTITSAQAAKYTIDSIFNKATAAPPFSYAANWVPSLITVPLTSVDGQSASQLPTSFALHQNYPNPFNPSTVIRYDLPKSGIVSLKVYDLFGREIATLVDGVKAAGTYQEIFNGQALASGIYFARLKTDAMSSTIKLLMVK